MYSFTHSLTLALDGGEWSASCPCCFTPKEGALVHFSLHENFTESYPEVAICRQGLISENVSP
jgi:hypothetical protein